MLKTETTMEIAVGKKALWKGVDKVTGGPFERPVTVVAVSPVEVTGYARRGFKDFKEDKKPLGALSWRSVTVETEDGKRHEVRSCELYDLK